MSQHLVILRGAPASGKSTIAKKLRNFYKKIVWLKVDNFKDFFSEDGSQGLEYANETAIVTLEYLLNKGFSVVMESIFKNPNFITKAVHITQNIGAPYKVFQIKCSLPVLRERDRTRPGIKEGCRKPLGDKVIADLYSILEDSFYEGATELNTENQSIENCVEIVRKEFST